MSKCQYDYECSVCEKNTCWFKQKESEEDDYQSSEAKTYDDMASAVGLFIAQCGEMAEQNWCKSQVDMLQRLFGAVLKGCKYDEWKREKENEQ